MIGYISQTELLGQSLHESKHGIGYLDFTYESNEGQKKADN